MLDFKKIFKEFEKCDCGLKHECDIRDIRVGSGIVRNVGKILRENLFPTKLLLVADRNTLRASEGICEAISDFEVTELIYDDLRVATMDVVNEVRETVQAHGLHAILAVGSGSIHDPCRLVAAKLDLPICLFATAPSMDGFASYNAPIVDRHFKETHSAKCPEVIIADTRILAAAPARLKSAGFGDMIGKYIALADWKIPYAIQGRSDDPYCEKVASLTRFAVDRCMKNASRITLEDEEAAAELFENLILSGIAMSFMKNSRPASGADHMMAHYIECKELLEDKIPSFHGEDVGISTLVMVKFYRSLLDIKEVTCHKEENDWDDIARAYGALAEGMQRMNTPTTVTDSIDPADIEAHWDEIRTIVAEIPPYEEVEAAMKAAGCPITAQDADKSEELLQEAFRYHPYMRRRLTLRRLINMIKLPQ